MIPLSLVQTAHTVAKNSTKTEEEYNAMLEYFLEFLIILFKDK
jgi:hypothetical protein